MRLFLIGLLALAALSTPAAAQPPVWIVHGKDSVVILFGSVHILPPGLDWEPPALDQALRSADDLWFEIPFDPASQASLGRMAIDRGLGPPGYSLSAALSPPDRARLQRVAARLGLQLAVLDRMKPWLADATVSVMAYRKAGAEGEDGVERQVALQAPQATRRAFETPEQQIDMLDHAPLADQIAGLADTLKDLEDDPGAYGRLLNQWMAGDVRGIQREALDPMRLSAPRLYKVLILDRNRAWTQAIAERLHGTGRTVMVVGAGHLVGPDGAPARLRALGYTVEGP